MSQYIQGLVPVVVGVTGHRDIPVEDILKLGSVTRSVLNKIAADTPHSPHVLITCLAEGGDRIAAICALELGWVLGVVLPSPAEVYELDFASAQSKDEFRRLLNAAAWVEIPGAGHSGKSDYAAASVRLMQQSQLMIAFWDGKSNGLSGGTSDVVEQFRSEIPRAGKGVTGNTHPDARPVFHILSRREREPDYLTSAQIGELTWLEPTPGGLSGEGEDERWRDVQSSIDIFNADAKEFLKSNLDDIKTSRRYLGAGEFDPKLATLPFSDASAAMFSIADSMSIHAQKERDNLFYKLAGFAMAAIILEQVYSNIYSSALILGLSVVSGFVALLIYKQGTKKRIESRCLDYRSLAEACRVQYYWKESRIQASVANSYLLEQRDGLEWIRQAIRTNELSIDFNLLQNPTNISTFQSVRKSWIEDQRKYFIRSTDRDENLCKAWSTRASTLFISGISVVILIAIFKSFLVEHFNDMGETITQYASLSYGLLFAFAGLIKVYQETKAFSEQSKSYRRGGLLMQRASQRLEAAIINQNIDDAQQIIFETGCEALDENGDWLLLHRDRPVEVPLG